MQWSAAGRRNCRNEKFEGKADGAMPSLRTLRSVKASGYILGSLGRMLTSGLTLLDDKVARPGERQAVWGVPRAPMTLAISEDGGRSWPHKRNLEVGDGYCMTNNSREQLNREYSYPSIKQGPDGTLHIAFTYFRQAIKYVRVLEDWVRR